MKHLTLVALLCAFAAVARGYGEEITLNLSSLDAWKPLTFPWVPRHSTYAVERASGEYIIRIRSDDSASGLEYRRDFSTYQTPVLEWSWKVENVLVNGNAATRSGDDYAARVYVMFPYDNASLTPFQRIQNQFLKDLLGYYPPSAILNYVWANRVHARNPIRNAYSSQGVMFFANSGTAHLGEWRTHRVNIVEDYRMVFHRDPPGSFTLAIMGDSDNTHGKTEAFVRDIRVRGDQTQMDPSR